MIQLNELKNYLGTRLKCEVLDNQCKVDNLTISELNALYDDGSATFHDLVESCQGFADIKPIVHPLSMLTEEIEHPVTGEKFVPVLELVKLITQNGFNVDNVSQVYFDDIQKVVTVVFESFKHPNSDLVVTRMFEIDTDEVSFSILTMDSENNVNYYLTGNIFEMYQKLFEWHFDVFDWIGKGLAIDKKETK